MSKNTEIIKNIITGVWVELFIKKANMRYVFFVVMLLLIYITFMTRVERTQIEINQLEKELKNARSEYVTITAKVFNLTLEHNIKKEIKKRNLELFSSDKPNKLIKIPKEKSRKNQ